MDKTLVHTPAYFEGPGPCALCSAGLLAMAHVSALKRCVVSPATDPGSV